MQVMSVVVAGNGDETPPPPMQPPTSSPFRASLSLALAVAQLALLAAAVVLLVRISRQPPAAPAPTVADYLKLRTSPAGLEEMRARTPYVEVHVENWPASLDGLAKLQAEIVNTQPLESHVSNLPMWAEADVVPVRVTR